MKPTSSRAIVGAVMPTLLGLLLLLMVPVWSQWQMEVIHRHIENQLIPAHEGIDETIAATHRLRNDIYTYTFTLDKARAVRYTLHKQEWQTAAQAVSRLALTGQAVADWQTGVGKMQQWLTVYGDRLIQDTAMDSSLPGEVQFEQGLDKMEAASVDLKRQTSELRKQVREWEQGALATMGGLGVVCVLLGLMAWRNVVALHRALGEASKNADRLEVAVKETNHRVKNNLQTIGALIDMNRQEHGEQIPARILDDIYQQVRTVAAVHDFLSHEHHANRVAIQPMLQKLVTLAASGKELKAEVASDAIDLPVKEATSIALITNELVLNAGKHGAKQIRVTFRVQDAHCVLQVCDDGPGLPPNFAVATHGNLGTTLIETLTKHDLCGGIQWRNGGNLSGAEVEITFAIPEND